MARDNKNVSPIRLEVLITIVDRRKGDFYADLLQSFDVNMQMLLSATGTAEKRMLDILGIADNEKAVIISVVREDRLEDIETVLEEKFASVKGGKGVSVAVPLSSIMGATAFGFLSNESGSISST
ncbi:MAG: hypothetical protein IJ796_02700 [Lachnospiraceae bacterium]|nr:hypothetical protein [Lachnospiraceae bacterium]